MKRLHPLPKECQTPRAAMFFINKWIADDNYILYNFWHTPKGPIMFRKTKENVFLIKEPNNHKWCVAGKKENFKLLASEMLAISFGWKGVSDVSTKQSKE